MNFKELDVWKRSARLSAEIYKATFNLNDFGFRDQLTRSGLSVPSNIAEGVSRLSDKETVQFLSIAKGSLAELETQVLIGMDIGYINKDVGKAWLEDINAIQAMLFGLSKRYKIIIATQNNQQLKGQANNTSKEK
ncbi:four helix bundle protein [Pseudoalteromonas sp. KG3]|uniref:four helix bundle protein n=1 Tax=Pseudoalteromonas sp. KG3 TaxID=2951137 RepID=UPI0026589CC2|nr:four helix bundle protein [Pseudoalteromonas sp. KG3]WKD22977.1 four helix bundle protein [Pseudoalteromonas sp. KG3]